MVPLPHIQEIYDSVFSVDHLSPDNSQYVSLFAWFAGDWMSNAIHACFMKKSKDV